MLGRRTRLGPFDNDFIVKGDNAAHIQRLFACVQLREKLCGVPSPWIEK